MSRRKNYDKSVFINCPFDEDYKPFFRAILFTVSECGFTPRTAKENNDSGIERVAFIQSIINQCKYGIHDLSRTQPDPDSGLPRFNMPFELGLFMGAHYSGRKKKEWLLMHTKRHEYKRFISDLSGRDIKSHDDRIEKLVQIVRDWLRGRTNESIPGEKILLNRIKAFNSGLPLICDELGHDPKNITYDDYINIMVEFQKKTSKSRAAR